MGSKVVMARKGAHSPAKMPWRIAPTRSFMGQLSTLKRRSLPQLFRGGSTNSVRFSEGSE